VTTSADLTPGTPHESQDGTDHDQDEPDDPKNGDLGYEANDQQDDAKHNHVASSKLPSGTARVVTVSSTGHATPQLGMNP
jgi:hypothetical protein